MNPSPAESLSDELSRLRRTMRDLVSFSALPAVWAGSDPPAIMDSLARTLIGSFSLSFVYIHTPHRLGEEGLELLRRGDSPASAAEIGRVRDAVVPLLQDAFRSVYSLSDPLGDGLVNVSITRFGFGQDGGVMIAAAPRRDFPNEQERLLLGVAANQAAVACQGSRAARANATLAAIVESSDDAVVSKTLEGIITSWNAGAERVFGYTPAETVGRSVLMLIPPELRREEDMILSRLRRGERIEHYETVRMRKDGRRIDVSLTVSPIRDETGRVTGASKIARDITERKRKDHEAAMLLQREQEALRESQILNELARTLGGELDLEKLVQKITDAGRELTDAQFGAFFYNTVNEAGESYVLYTLSGAPKEAFEKFGLPRNTPLFGPTFRGEGVVRVADVLKDSRYGKNPPHQGMPKGHLPVRSYLAVPVLSREGAVLGGLFFGHPEVGVFTERAERLALGVAAQASICFDNAQLYREAQKEIAERKAAEEREREARTQAERATRLRDEFLATVSHELRTPLNSMLGWVQLLRKHPKDQETYTQAIEAVERGTRAQVRLVEDLLDMGRIISGKLRLDVETVDLVQVVRAAIDTLLPAAQAKNIRIEQVLDPRAGPIKGDAARLQQVMWNLISNAVKFTPKEGKIQVHLERVNSHVEISVSDTGRGIRPDFLPHVFERFRQADSSTTRSHGGLGLGLAVVKHLVELHGGHATAQSEGENKGATFTVHLPIAIMHKEPAERRATPAQPQGEEWAQLVDVRVLVVDDDHDACEMLRRVLRDRGAKVEIVQSARDALNRLGEIRPQILVSDIGMPEMDGYQLIREVRTRGLSIPAVAVTAFARSDDRIRSLRAGYDMHLAKPLEPGELVEIIATLVRPDRRPQST